MSHRTVPALPLFIILTGALFILALLSLGLGRLNIPPATTLRIVCGRFVPLAPDWSATWESVVWDVRFPRLVAGMLVGGGLALSGASFQGIFRNPLVSPHILGVSAGAGFGAALGLLFSGHIVVVQALAFIFGVLTVAVTYALSRTYRSSQMLMLVLSGIIVGGFKVFSAKVEEVICRHPAVHMAALIGIENPERPGSELVKAYITLKEGYRTGRDPETLKEEILTFAADKLSPYELPKDLEIRAELPLTAVGKVDKKVLRKEARQVWAGKERRTRTRGAVDLPCDVRGFSNGKETHENGHVANLSHEGMFIEAETPLDEGTDMAAQIMVIQFGDTLWVKGEVLRKTERGNAVRFKESIPPEIDTILGSERK